MKLGGGAPKTLSHFAPASKKPPAPTEELIGAAHAGCFSMFLSALLTKAGFTPTSISTTAKVHLGEGPAITLIELTTEAVVPNLEDAIFQENVTAAKQNCPISKALASVNISVNATLVG